MIFLDVHGVSIRVNSTDNFELFVKNTLSYFFVDVNNQSKPDICVDIDLGNETDHNSYLCKARKIGRNAYIKDNFFYCTSGDYFVIAEKDSECININVSLVKTSSIKGKLKRIIKEIIRPHDKYLLVRHYVIFPLFSLLNNLKNINVLHASAINIDGNGIIFSGLSGVGKSTLSIASVIKDKGSFITDNYLLYDDSKIYPFPEWIRLNKESYKLTGVDETGVVGKITHSFFYRFGRNYHQLESNVISAPVKCSAFVQLFLGDKFSADIISAEKAIDRVILNNAHVKEFPEHALIGLLPYLLENNTFQHNTMMESLKSILANSVIYEIVINREDSIKDSIDKILAILKIDK